MSQQWPNCFQVVHYVCKDFSKAEIVEKVKLRVEVRDLKFLKKLRESELVVSDFTSNFNFEKLELVISRIFFLKLELVISNCNSQMLDVRVGNLNMVAIY